MAKLSFFVVGCGSIGMRHIRNLLSMGHGVFATDTMEQGRKAAEAGLKIRTFPSLEAGLARHPDAVLVCTPPPTHLQIARKALADGCHVFIEKPVSDSLSGIGEIAALAKRKKKVVQIGYNLRFVPGLAAMKKAIGSGKYGRPLYAMISFSQYLPYWRPGTDYRKGYTGKKKYGGGIILEASHELDYACWLLGKPKALSCHARRVSGLEVDTEDSADILLDFESGAAASVHLDFVRQDYSRRCELVCEKGTLAWKLEWKAMRNTLEERASDGERISSRLLLDVPWEANDMYVAEMRAFASAIGGRPDRGAAVIADGKLALELALKSLESSKKGKKLKL